MESFNSFTFTVHMGPNCYINTGVRDLEVALFKANSIPEGMALVAKIY